jgi:hypothetical protein
MAVSSHGLSWQDTRTVEIAFSYKLSVLQNSCPVYCAGLTTAQHLLQDSKIRAICVLYTLRQLETLQGCSAPGGGQPTQYTRRATVQSEDQAASHGDCQEGVTAAGEAAGHTPTWDEVMPHHTCYGDLCRAADAGSPCPQQSSTEQKQRAFLSYQAGCWLETSSVTKSQHCVGAGTHCQL